MYDTSISGVSSNFDCIPKISTCACHGSYYRWRQVVVIEDVRQSLGRALLTYHSVKLKSHELVRAMRG